jgi:hypothetical protein
VVDVQTANAIQTFRPVSDQARFIIVTLEITYLGPESKGRFSPSSLIMVNLDAERTGWSNFTNLYKREGASTFIEPQLAPSMRVVSSGETIVEDFAFVFLRVGRRCVLYFPEMQGIFIELSDVTPLTTPAPRLNTPTLPPNPTRRPSTTPRRAPTGTPSVST